jgi:hypothetical protein
VNVFSKIYLWKSHVNRIENFIFREYDGLHVNKNEQYRFCIKTLYIMDSSIILIIISGLIIVSLLISQTFRNVVRWIIYLPLSFGIALLLNFINFFDLIAGLVFKQVSYVVSLLIDVCSISQDVLVILLCSSIFAPKKRLGVIIASMICLLTEIYHILKLKLCAIYPLGYEEIKEVDWTHTFVLLCVSVVIMFVMIKNKKDAE